MAPTFTLRLANVPIKEFHGRTFSFVPRARWLIESDDPSWTPLNSSEGNINSAAHVEWAQRWATAEVAEHSPYTVVRWIEDDEHHDGPAWAAELKHIRHEFRVAWTDANRAALWANNAADAEEVQQDIRGGAGYIQLTNDNGDPMFVNLAHVFAITYMQTEVDL